MRSEGFLCEEAENGRVAQEALSREPAILVLSDLHMPEIDGIGLLRHVRATYPDTAVILITAGLVTMLPSGASSSIVPLDGLVVTPVTKLPTSGIEF